MVKNITVTKMVHPSGRCMKLLIVIGINLQLVLQHMGHIIPLQTKLQTTHTEQVLQVHVQMLAKEEQNTVQVEQVHVVQYQADTIQQDVMDQEITVLAKHNAQQELIVLVEYHIIVVVENGVMLVQHHVQI